jgi:hypothetical protein
MEPSDTHGRRELDPQDLWNQLSNAASLRSSEDQVLWMISGIFWAADALLLVALFQKGELPEANAPPLVVSAVGMALSTIQYFLQGRTLGHIHRYDALITRLERALERALDFAPEYAVSADLNTADADHYLGGHKGNVWRKLRMGTLGRVGSFMQGASLGWALFWAAVFSFVLYRVFCGT